MYSPWVVERRIEDLLGSEFGPVIRALPGGALQRYSNTDRDQLKKQLHRLDKHERPNPALTADEHAFITNEAILSKVDFEYWATGYAKIIRPDHGLSPLFPLWESQDLILKEIARVEEDHWKQNHPDGLLFNILKGRQLGACVDPSTRVLTADLRWVTADAIGVGTEIVAVDEEIPGGRGAARKMRTAVIEAKADVREPSFEVVFASGSSVTCSATHRWLYRTATQDQCNWRAVGTMKVGGYIRRIAEPWGPSSLEDYWMGGMLDGEGSCNAKSSGGAEICVAQRPGAVFERLRAYFNDRDYAAKEDADKAERRTKFGKTPVPRFSLSRMSEIFRLLGQTRPTRFIGRRWWEGKELPGKRNGGYGWERIVAIRPLGQQRLVDLQTSTKTFIAEGLVSHNSTLCQAMLAHRVTTQSYTYGLIASDVPENSGSTGLFGKLELTVEHLPWWLVPKQLYHTKNQHIVFANAAGKAGSSILVESGKSMKGALQDEGGSKGQMGRSKTYSCLHLSELSTWENAGQIDDSLMPAVPQTPRTLMALESTAKGRGNWWHDQWKVTEKGLNRFFNIFIPWYAEKTKNWRPAPVDWVPDSDTLAYANRVEQVAPRFMRRAFRLTRGQLYWYYTERRQAMEKGTLYKFLEEQPAEPDEAFQYSGISVFPPQVLDEVRNMAKAPIRLYAVEPTSLITETRTIQQEEAQIVAAAKAQEIKSARPPLPKKLARLTDEAWKIPPGYGFRAVKLSELQDQHARGLQLLNWFQIWELPKKGARYVVSADVSDGLGADRSVVDVIREGTVERGEEQVAQFISDCVKPRELAFIIDAIGHLYCDDDGLEAVAAIEINSHGLSTQDTLQLHLGYRNFYIWEVADQRNPSSRFTTRIGWFTSPRTRPLILNDFHEAVLTKDELTGERDFQINSSWTIEDMSNLIVPDGGRIGDAEANKGATDDAVMSAAIGHYVVWRRAGGEREPLSEQRKRWRAQEYLRKRQLADEEVDADFRNMPYTADESGGGHVPLEQQMRQEIDELMDVRGVVYEEF